MHLLVDGYGGDVEKMKEEEAVYSFLDTYPSEMGMTKISVPLVTTYKGPENADWGVSGFVMIAESHISVHTFPERAYVNIDVFSCKDFDDQKALAQIKKVFALDQVKVWILGRGLDYSRPSFRGPVKRGRAKASLTEVGG